MYTILIPTYATHFDHNRQLFGLLNNSEPLIWTAKRVHDNSGMHNSGMPSSNKQCSSVICSA
jgi:hypothetical protein